MWEAGYTVYSVIRGYNIYRITSCTTINIIANPIPLANLTATRSEAVGVEIGDHSTPLHHITQLLQQNDNNFFATPLYDEELASEKS